MLGIVTEVEALKKVVPRPRKGQPQSRLFVRSMRPGLLKLSKSFKRP